jgi:hypothetical protein
MIKNLIAILLLVASITVQGQSLSFKDSLIIEEGSSSLDDIIVHCWFYNKSGKTNLRWTRVQNNLPNGWESAVCDNVQCYGPLVSEATFMMPNNDSFNFSFHFYANKFGGTGSMNVCVYSVNDSTIKTCGTFSVVGWGVGVEDISNSMYLYPNPANKVVNIKSPLIGSGVMILEKTFYGISNNISVEDLPNGCYTLSLESASGLIHQKLFVQH